MDKLVAIHVPWKIEKSTGSFKVVIWMTYAFKSLKIWEETTQKKKDDRKKNMYICQTSSLFILCEVALINFLPICSSCPFSKHSLLTQLLFPGKYWPEQFMYVFGICRTDLSWIIYDSSIVKQYLLTSISSTKRYESEFSARHHVGLKGSSSTTHHHILCFVE